MFMKTTQAQTQVLAEPQEQSLKARSPETYLEKSHMDYYNFCQQCEDYFESSSATGMNSTPFAASFSVAPSASDGLSTSAAARAPL